MSSTTASSSRSQARRRAITSSVASSRSPSLLGAARGYPRLRGGRRAALALTLGVLGLAAGGEAWHYTSTVGASGDDYTGLLAILAGLLLLAIGVVTLWRTRRVDGSPPRPDLPPSPLGAAGVPLFVYLVVPVG